MSVGTINRKHKRKTVVIASPEQEERINQELKYEHSEKTYIRSENIDKDNKSQYNFENSEQQQPNNKKDNLEQHESRRWKKCLTMKLQKAYQLRDKKSERDPTSS